MLRCAEIQTIDLRACLRTWQSYRPTLKSRYGARRRQFDYRRTNRSEYGRYDTYLHVWCHGIRRDDYRITVHARIVSQL